MLFFTYSNLYEEEGMSKLISASLFLFVFVILNTKSFAGDLDCKFKNVKMVGVDSIRLSDDYLIINQELEIPLEKSRVKCANFGRQMRFDGSALGYQVVLKSCTTEATLEGHLIDSENFIAADVLCHTASEE
jgi:hypothetical protein